MNMTSSPCTQPFPLGPRRQASSSGRLFGRVLIGLAAIATFISASCATEEQGVEAPRFSVPGATIGRAAKGDECNDPQGDLSDSVRGTGTLSEPAGIDLLRAEAKVEAELLNVSYTTAAPIESVTNPVFFLQQGDTSQALNVTFEVRAEKDQSAGGWKLRLITFTGNSERSTPLEATVNVVDNKLTYSVPVKSLPQIATILWQFGSTGGVSSNNRLIDDCLPFNQAPEPGQGPAGSSTSTMAVAARTGSLGQPITASDESKITVKAVVNPAKPGRQMVAQPIPLNQLAAVEAEVCAGSSAVERVGEFRFTVQLADGRSFDPWAADDYSNEPRFKLETSLRPGECEHGWINYEVPKDSQITKVTYDVAGKKVGPYVVITVS